MFSRRWFHAQATLPQRLTSSWWLISGTSNWRSSSPVQCVCFSPYAAYISQLVISFKKLVWEEARTVGHHSTDTTSIVERATPSSACDESSSECITLILQLLDPTCLAEL